MPSSAVEALRGTLEAVGPALHDTPIWIDAICINQGDLSEKAQQVAIMGCVFFEASRAHVWLGLDPCHPTGDAATLIRDIAHHSRTQSIRVEHPVSRMQLAAIYAPVVEISKSAHWDDLCCLYDRPWFSRLWVVQEVCLAKAALCCFGSNKLDWEDVESCASWLRNDIDRGGAAWQALSKNSRSFEGTTKGLESVRRIRTIKHAMSQGDGGDLFSVLINTCPMFATTLPHDMVYAFLGLLSQPSITMTSPLAALQPAYDTPVAQVHAAAARLAIVETRTLAVLAARDRAGTPYLPLEDLPSWVPIFNQLTALRDNARLVLMSCNCNNLSASRPAAPVSCVEERWDILAVEGFHFQEVRSAGTNFEYNIFDCEDAGPTLVSRLAAGLSMAVGGNREVSPRIAQCNLQQVLSGGNRFPWVDYNNLEPPEWDDIIATILRAGETCQPGQELVTISTALRESYSMDILACVNRRLFIMANGQLALGHPNVLTGDMVCILVGGQFPVILRARGHEWTFVGHAYVPGVSEVLSTSSPATPSMMLMQNT